MGTNGFLTRRISPQFWEAVYGLDKLPHVLAGYPPQAIKTSADNCLLNVLRYMELTFAEGITVHDVALTCAGVREPDVRGEFITSGTMDTAHRHSFHGTLYVHMLRQFETIARRDKALIAATGATALQCFHASVISSFLTQALIASAAGDGELWNYMVDELRADQPEVALQLAMGQDPHGIIQRLPNAFKRDWRYVSGLPLGNDFIAVN